MIESLKIAGLNTLMGMGTVFFVLIMISIIIYLFSFIGRMQNKKTVSSHEITFEAEISEENAGEEVDLEDEYELVAVIMAAIAASEDVPVDSLIVRSIRRRPSSGRWKNA